jgi:purine-binding chemotaxis protein CheW
MKNALTSNARSSGPDALRTREILTARARALARPYRRPPAADQAIEIVDFRLAQESFGIEQTFVREVQPLRELTPLPCTPPFIRGIINVRGEILPVLDMKIFFELPGAGIADLHMVIIVHAGDVELGILADVVTGTRSVPLNTLQPCPPTLAGARMKYLKGVTNEGMVILDVARILSDADITVNEEVPS